MATSDPAARILTAEILSIGTELTVGDTRDTNAGELARRLTALGVAVTRMSVLPDRLDVVSRAFTVGIERSDLVVSTGGLGPTPDDLTREAIAATLDETVTVDPALERWLRALWSRRGASFPELNLKQAWLIPSASALANPNGTAPGWFVRTSAGRVIVALPGPPREMRPMWSDEALPRLQAIGLGADLFAVTYRLAGIGESQVADVLGEQLLRTASPEVATYARAEAVDVRISAIGMEAGEAERTVAPAAAIVEERLRRWIWATGTTTWSEAIGARLAASGWTLATVELGTRGQLVSLLGDVDWLVSATSRSSPTTDAGAGIDHADILALARDARTGAPANVGVAVHLAEGADDGLVTIAVSAPSGELVEERTVFIAGSIGRTRAALAAAAVLLDALDPRTPPAAT